MDSELWRRLRLAYDQVLDAPEADRQRLIEELTRTDPELGRELAKLLAAEKAPSTFLETPVVRLVVADLEPGVILCSRFRLLRRIGHGGMGDVWAARDEKLNEDVAVKTIRADLAQDPQQLSRLKRELLLARRVAHPNVCKVFDLFEHVSDPHPVSFLTMELIEGETLADRLAREKTLPFADALRVVRDVADGLAAAHAAGVVHRDLKPANVILTGDESRRTVILDFGLARDPARVESDGATAFGTLVGTPEYMAPEQISGAAVTPATDLYALGLMFFEMLDGTRPFAGVSTPDSWMRRAREGPKPLSGSVDGVRARIDGVIQKCLAYEPAERYQSAAELLGALSSTRLSFVLPEDRRVWLAVAALVLAVLGASGFAAWRRFTPQLPPAEAMKWFEEAQQALAEGASVRALNDVNRAIELAPWFAPSHALLAEVRLELDMPGRAQEAMLKASELARQGRAVPDPHGRYINGMQALILRQCDQAIAEFRAVASVNDPMRPYRMVSAARAMERCDRREEALAVMSDAAALDPRNAAVSLRQAAIAASSSDYDAAIERLLRAEQLFRDRNNVEGAGEVAIMRASVASAQDQLASAEQSLAQATQIAESLDDPRQQIKTALQSAIVLRKRGRIDEAKALTTRALDFARRANLETLALEGLLTAGNAHLVLGQFDEAESLFNRVLEIAESSRHEEYGARARLLLGSVLFRTTRPALASESLNVARAYYSRVGAVRYLAAVNTLIAQVAVMRGDAETTVTLSNAVLQTDSPLDREQEATARENLATAFAATGSYPHALREYEQARTLRANSGRARSEFFALLNIAEMQSNLGRFDAAARTLAEAKAMMPMSPDMEAQRLRVEIAHDLRQGHYTVAARRANELIDRWGELSVDRRMRTTLLLCVAESHLRTVRDARALCDTVRQEARERGHLEMLYEATLALAHAHLHTGDRGAADAMLSTVDLPLFPAGPSGVRWRHLALMSAAAPSGEAAERQAAMALEADGLRRKWGEAMFSSWSTRADVRELRALALAIVS